MNEPSANPIWVALFCVIRCVIPLVLLLGVSYLLRKLGLVREPEQPPPEDTTGTNNSSEGGFVHGSI
jgi:hypothetical protein